MAINGQASLEGDEHGFAFRGGLANPLAAQFLVEFPQPRQAEVDLHGLVIDDFADLVGFKANFRSFGHLFQGFRNCAGTRGRPLNVILMSTHPIMGDPSPGSAGHPPGHPRPAGKGG